MSAPPAPDGRDEQPELDLLVLADDRTGALEASGMCADAGLITVMMPWISHAPTATTSTSQSQAVITPRPPPHRCRVVDIGSRHLDTAEAARRAVAAARDAPARRRDAHKIDSTLRGNWAAELVARYRATGRRTILVPAFPAAGRTCVGGIVREHDVPVAEGAAGRDRLRPVASSSPAEHLRHEGAGGVAEVEDATELARWIDSQSAFAVCDAAADVEIVLLAEQWVAHPDIVFAGTAAAIGAAARVSVASHHRPDPPQVAGDILVVCGSLHRSARGQIAVLRGTAGRHTVLASPDLVVDADVIDVEEAQRAARLLAAAARRMLNRRPYGAVVLIGGDTAAAFLGEDPLVVGGTVAVGVPWCRAADGRGPLLLTKPGGFGDSRALVDLVTAILER